MGDIMQGIHCPICKELGPDLVIDPEKVSVQISDGVNHAEVVAVTTKFEFTCGNCNRRWGWTINITLPNKQISYHNPQRIE